MTYDHNHNYCPECENSPCECKIPKLKRCLFCKSTEVAIISSGANFCYVGCYNCEAAGPIAKTKAEAAKLWNAAVIKIADELARATKDTNKPTRLIEDAKRLKERLARMNEYFFQKKLDSMTAPPLELPKPVAFNHLIYEKLTTPSASDYIYRHLEWLETEVAQERISDTVAVRLRHRDKDGYIKKEYLVFSPPGYAALTDEDIAEWVTSEVIRKLRRKERK